ncbi:MAG: cytochrome c biosis protein ResB [Glaciihabitans sp.]|nr:cytochrome c biosis protein ResB [Glaciihabitans sp.]
MASSRSSDSSASEQSATDPRRPSDHFDTPAPQAPEPGIVQPKLGFVGMARFFWRQLTSMRTALLLLLLVAFAAVPGSLVPQVTSDPNGVIQYKAANPEWSKVLDFLGVFNTYTSVWFSAIYLLLFISLVGCIIPRTKHHFDALRAAPPKTPVRLDRLAGFRSSEDAEASDVDVEAGLGAAREQLRKAGYRVRVFPGESVSAERGYLRETGNLIFHMALVGILAAVGFGGGFIYTGQKVVVVGQSFANTLSDYDSISPGRWFDPDSLSPYSLKLTKFNAVYESKNVNAYGEAIDYTAYVRTSVPGQKPQNQTIKVNSPLTLGNTDIYLLGNGYAPVITVRDPAGKIVFSQPEPFLAQDANLTSDGVVKIPFGLSKQVALSGFFYPTKCTICGSNLSSVHPDLLDPVLTLQVFTGNLGLDNGTAVNAFALNRDNLTQLNGFGTKKPGITLTPGQTTKLPNGLGTVSFDKVVRYASLDIHHDPTQLWVLAFAILVFLGLITGLFVPRRRVWIKAVRTTRGVHFEYAGLARGEDPRLDDAVTEIAKKHSQRTGLTIKP